MNYLAFLLQAVVLWFVLFIILRDGSARSYSTMFYVSVGITLAVIGLHFAIPRWSLPVAAEMCIRDREGFSPSLQSSPFPPNDSTVQTADETISCLY